MSTPISFDVSDQAHVEAFADLGRARHADDPYHLREQMPAGEPSQRYFGVTRTGELKARVVADASTGFLGYYEAATDVTVDEVKRLLNAACRHLKEAGCRRAIGPVNGSTWGAYRFALPSRNRPFFLDVHHPEEYLVQWLSAGFRSVERYLSTVIDTISPEAPPRFSKRLAGRGITIEGMSPLRFGSELRAIHALCNTAFASNPYFSPISYAEFEALYRPLAATVDVDWTMVARSASGELLGFIFATPDRFDLERRGLVIKTVASRAPGLGSFLTGLLHRRAHDAGYQRIYHALMHEDNASTKIHAQAATVYRRYVLLGKTL